MRCVLLAGSSHPALAADVAKAMGVPLSRCTIERFPDGELDVDLEERVRGAEVFVLQSLHAPVGEHLLELSLIADACYRSGAASVSSCEIIPPRLTPTR